MNFLLLHKRSSRTLMCHLCYLSPQRQGLDTRVILSFKYCSAKLALYRTWCFTDETMNILN